MGKTIFYGAFIALLLIALMVGCHRCGQPGPDGRGVATDLPDTLTWITTGGDIASSVKGTEEQFAHVDVRVADSIASVYKTREDNLQEYIVALTRENTQLKAVAGSRQVDYSPGVILKADTCPPQIRNIRTRFSSAYYKADVQLGDSQYLNLQAYDTLTAVWKTITLGGLFNRRTYLQLDLSMANPAAEVYGIKAYRRAIPKKKWALSVFAGYGAALGPLPSIGPVVGIGISRNLINF